MNSSPAGILLAAGYSRRFGENKLLHTLDEFDQPMLFVTAQKILSVTNKCIAVINHSLEAYTAQLEQMGIQVVINKQSQKGIGSSIACGIRAAQHASGWLITLADMPYIETSTLQRLVEKLIAGAHIVAPTYQHQRGHPVGFHHQYGSELMTLDNDIGAREIIARHIKQLELIPTEDKGVIMDIDRPGDCH